MLYATVGTSITERILHFDQTLQCEQIARNIHTSLASAVMLRANDHLCNTS